MSQPKVAIAVTADDKTAKGFASAEKRAARTVGGMADANKRWARDAQAAVSRSGYGMVGTLSRVEEAGAKLFGGRSITSGVTSRLSAMGEAAGAARVGMAGAAGAGGVLEMAAAGVGVAVGATVGILAAAGYAAFKLADGWAKGAASIGRTAETIGVGTKALQEFTAAAERQGVDKGAATGSLGSLSQTLNDARYGRNNAALAVLSRLGVKMKLNSDGTVNVAAMLPAIADAIARQNSSGRRTAASNLGIGLDALPVFAQGGKALSADMSDADAHAAMIDDAGIATGRRVAREGVMVGQLKDRAMVAAGAATAGAVERGYDAVLSGARQIADGSASFGGIVKRTFAPAAETIGRAAGKIEGAGNALLVAARAFFEGRGWTRAQASGIVAGLHRESLLKPGAVGDGGAAYGIGQWHRDRQRNFERVFGHGIRGSSREEQLGFVDWELRNTEARAGRHLSGARSAYEAGDAVSRFYERPGDREGEARFRGRSAEQVAAMAEVPVRVEVLLPNAPRGTRAKVTAGRGARPAVSHAMAN